MKVGIMQPYFFPYLGYFSLIKHTDRFILFDTVQFIRHGWIERNRILKQEKSWLYIQVPLIKKSHASLINEVKINNAENWKSKIIAQLQPYKKISPNYFNVIRLVNEVFESDYDDIVTLNKCCLEKVCEYLNIKKTIDIFSEMKLEIDEVKASDEWALNICKAIDGANEYWNLPNGESFFDRKKYREANIDLKFLSVSLNEYNQQRTPFEPGLSILDVLMFNTVEEVNKMMDNFTLT